MKKGISLIVLVITIIVMIIIAGAIILSLNSSNVTGKANWATLSSDRANLQSEFAVVLADYLAAEEDVITVDGLKAYDKYTAWKTKVENAGFVVNDTVTDPAGVTVVYQGTAIFGAPTNTPAWYDPQ